MISKTHYKNKKQCGFSLIEVLISFLLLGVGVLGLLKMQNTLAVQSEYASRSLVALDLAQSKMHWFRTRSISGANNTIAFSSIADNSVITLDGYHVRWEVEAGLGSTLQSIKRVRVISSWQDRFDVTQQVTLETMISQHSEFQ
ncbi:prepilin-type N-terminal cleavage/methylation domain-containing protein [Vibrio tapetis subsp. quintayensis]|uniref:type IV pilus modification PilV family protein n=1 Tax=Vibrio tapetis TaxID=52443 RepID=UPI0025B5096F|nr:prepilin-type N-terminal cleavage/methylation domain-containing protein [Vibrio tapetis]MDN3680064.1 prepilin-type N-terminal cleavage/methylation domain-containing protein [Vibrio tapetis subsp. quintayensis]